MITSRLHSQDQITLPHAVMVALQLKDGDDIAYSIEGDRVVMTRASRSSGDDIFTTFDQDDVDAVRR